MQHRLMTDTAVMTARPAPLAPAARFNPRQAVAAPAADWRVTFALAAVAFVAAFGVVAFVL